MIQRTSNRYKALSNSVGGVFKNGITKKNVNASSQNKLIAEFHCSDLPHVWFCGPVGKEGAYLMSSQMVLSLLGVLES